jgi:hypothetical protein
MLHDQSRRLHGFGGNPTTVTFHLDPHIKLPSTIVYGIAYNTSHFGFTPYGESTPCYTSSGGCPYDSLNIALSQDPANIKFGSDVNPGTLWQDSPYRSEYCDGGTAGTNEFRLDSPGADNNCWSVNSTSAPWLSSYYVPAVRFG